MKPILMNGESVRGILEGRKTQTRRVINRPGPYQSVLSHGQTWLWDGPGRSNKTLAIPQGLWLEHCPYGQVGDRLWVKETHYRFGRWVPNGFSKTGKQKWTFKAGTLEVLYMDNPPTLNVLRNSNRMERGWFKRPAIFMHRWASRITLEITSVKVERIQDITTQDIWAEGVTLTDYIRDDFQRLWDSINAKRGYGFDVNPWDFALTFKVVE